MASDDRTGQPWSDVENDSIVEIYFELLRAEIAESPLVKAEANRRVQERTGRGRGSVEYKFQNISAVLIEMGLPYVKGYKPYSNVQASLSSAVERGLALSASKATLEQAKVRLAAKVMTPGADFLWDVRTEVPYREHSPHYEAHRRARKVDYAEIEERNRSLGLAGELAVLKREHRILSRHGREDLAQKIRHVSAEDGDGLGYDILSFSPEGERRLIEVKATRQGAYASMYVSRNEVNFSSDNPEEFELHRVFDYRPESAGIYVLPGPIDESCWLRPTSYDATPRAANFSAHAEYIS